jgi:hypothetical protein
MKSLINHGVRDRKKVGKRCSSGIRIHDPVFERQKTAHASKMKLCSIREKALMSCLSTETFLNICKTA